ncbi:MAG: HEAT repeat domain-containing protein [Gemmatimonadota bacterium]
MTSRSLRATSRMSLTPTVPPAITRVTARVSTPLPALVRTTRHAFVRARALTVTLVLAQLLVHPDSLSAQQKTPPPPPPPRATTPRPLPKEPRPAWDPLDTQWRALELRENAIRDRWDDRDTPMARSFDSDLSWRLTSQIASDRARDLAEEFRLKRDGLADQAREMALDAGRRLATQASLSPAWPAMPLASAEGALDALGATREAFAPSLTSRWTVDGDAMRPRAPYLQGDPADSLYRLARELLNSGEYRRAAVAFRELSSRMPTSGYAPDALYWQAFALYRIGGTTEMRSAIEALELQKAKYPGARLQSENATLSLRIRGALAVRGDAAAAAAIRTAAGDSALRCDREEQAVRVEALNALTQSDPDGAMPILQKTLARRDSCSATLRRTAVFLIGNKNRDAGGVALLAQVARNDPSVEVRGSALEWLARVPGDDALAVLEELSRDTSEARVQQAAVRALVRHTSPRARQLVRSIVERSDSPERLRLEALSAFDKDRATSDDIAWMRTLYARTDNERVKARIVNTLANIGGDDVDQWMLTMARNVDESSDTRRYAVRRVGRRLPIAELAKLYDTSTERAIREVLIETLAQRAEGEATDKLLDIVKSGTDPQLRSRAISALTRKKDPRTLRLLMEIIDK